MSLTHCHCVKSISHEYSSASRLEVCRRGQVLYLETFHLAIQRDCGCKRTKAFRPGESQLLDQLILLFWCIRNLDRRRSVQEAFAIWPRDAELPNVRAVGIGVIAWRVEN